MRILIDGNDGVGKTTLALRLKEDLGIKSYIHLSGRDPRDYEFYHNILKKENVIFDRSFMDERIYSQVLKRECTLLPVDEARLHGQLDTEDAFVIICHSAEQIFHDDESEDVIKAAPIINQYFITLALNKGYLLYDTRADSYENLLKSIKEHYKK